MSNLDISDEMENVASCLRVLQTLVGCSDTNASINLGDLYYLMGLVTEKHQTILDKITG